MLAVVAFFRGSCKRQLAAHVASHGLSLTASLELTEDQRAALSPVDIVAHEEALDAAVLQYLTEKLTSNEELRAVRVRVCVCVLCVTVCVMCMCACVHVIVRTYARACVHMCLQCLSMPLHVRVYVSSGFGFVNGVHFVG